MKKEVEVQKIKVLDKLTYAEAVKVASKREDHKKRAAETVSAIPVPAWGGARNRLTWKICGARETPYT